MLSKRYQSHGIDRYNCLHVPSVAYDQPAVKLTKRLRNKKETSAYMN